jgi:hypothetical protein
MTVARPSHLEAALEFIADDLVLGIKDGVVGNDGTGSVIFFRCCRLKRNSFGKLSENV